MDTSTLGSLFMGKRPTAVVVTPTPTEIVPYKITSGIINYVLSNRYAGDRHPGEHLLYLSKLCSLFKLAGVSLEFVMKGLFGSQPKLATPNLSHATTSLACVWFIVILVACHTLLVLWST